MLIFEGCDGAGRAKLALECCKHLAAQGKLAGFRRYGALPYDWDYCGDYLRDIMPGTVLDRFVLSEDARCALAHTEPSLLLTPLARAVIARECALSGALTVYVRSPQLAGDLEQAELDKRFASVPCPHMVTSLGEANALSLLEKSAQLEAEGAAVRVLKIDGHGPVGARCQAVLIGEQSAGAIVPYTCAPRCFAQGPASEFLQQVIVQVGLEPARVFTVNALQHGGRQLPREAVAWAINCRVPIVALGKVATQVCRELRLPVIEASHPQYVKRFRHLETQSYVNKLREQLAQHSRVTA